MNVIWIVADTFRQDHLGAYEKMPEIRTPSLDALAARAVRFDRHYAGGFPTMPTRADHATGRWTASFMSWEPLPPGTATLAEILSSEGIHTAAMVDTPFYLRDGMNYDRGFQTFTVYSGQMGGGGIPQGAASHESEDARYAWRYESDRNVARTITNAMEWLQLHYTEDLFLYVDTWDPHEPWDAPSYYTKLYMPDYDGEIVHPVYGRWQDMPGYSAELVEKAHATYCGEVTMVDTWIGYLIGMVENMGLMDKTAIIFTSDHGFYFGEHGGRFGKLQFAKKPDGALFQFGESNTKWDFSPLYEELGVDTSVGLRAQLRAGKVRRFDVGHRCDAYGAGHHGFRPALVGRRTVALGAYARPVATGSGIHSDDRAVCESWRRRACGR